MAGTGTALLLLLFSHPQHPTWVDFCWPQPILVFWKSSAVQGAWSCTFGESQLRFWPRSQQDQSWDWWQARNRSQQTRRIDRTGLEAESWDLGCRGEDGGEGMLGLRRSLGWAVGLRQERIWDKGWQKYSGTERFRGCFELSYLMGVCKAGHVTGLWKRTVGLALGCGMGIQCRCPWGGQLGVWGVVLGKGFSLRELGVDFCVRRPTAHLLTPVSPLHTTTAPGRTGLFLPADTYPFARGKRGAKREHRAHPSALCLSSHCSCGVEATAPSLAHVPGKESQGPVWGSWARGAWGQIMAHAAVFHLGKGLLSTKGKK